MNGPSNRLILKFSIFDLKSFSKEFESLYIDAFGQTTKAGSRNLSRTEKVIVDVEIKIQEQHSW